jgi:hypothetical protein
VILNGGDVEIMYQSLASARKDASAAAAEIHGGRTPRDTSSSLPR